MIIIQCLFELVVPLGYIVQISVIQVKEINISRGQHDTNALGGGASLITCTQLKDRGSRGQGVKGLVHFQCILPGTSTTLG